MENLKKYGLGVWDDEEYTWDDAVLSWDSDENIFANQSKNSATIINLSKS